MNAKWSISNQPVLAAVICLLLLWCGALSAQERDTVIIVKHDTVYLQRKPDTIVTAVHVTAVTTGVCTAIANIGKP